MHYEVKRTDDPRIFKVTTPSTIFQVKDAHSPWDFKYRSATFRLGDWMHNQEDPGSKWRLAIEEIIYLQVRIF